MKLRGISYYWNALLISIVFWLLTSPAFADTAIVIGEADRSSRTVGAIIREIQELDAGAKVIDSSSTPETLQPFTDFIVLGRSAYEAPLVLPSNASAVGGAFLGIPENPNGIDAISFDIAPQLLTDEILKLNSKLIRVHTVSTGSIDEQYLQIMSAALASQNIDLIVKESTGIKSTARAWFDIALDVDPQKDAIWISDAGNLDESGAFRYLLEEAWKKNIFVFTTVPRLANRGVSLGFLPDIRRYSELLVNYRASEEEAASGFIDDPKTIRRVFNRRTLIHIGLSLPRDLDQDGRQDMVIK